MAAATTPTDQKELVNTLYESFRKDFQVFVASYIVNVTTKIKSKYPLAQVDEDLKKLFKEAGFSDDVVTSVAAKKRVAKPKKDNPDAKQCTALKANKQPCSKNATAGSVYCKLHKNKLDAAAAKTNGGTAAAVAATPAAATKKKKAAESKKVAKIDKEESDDDDVAASDPDEEDK